MYASTVGIVISRLFLWAMHPSPRKVACAQTGDVCTQATGKEAFKELDDFYDGLEASVIGLLRQMLYVSTCSYRWRNSVQEWGASEQQSKKWHWAKRGWSKRVNPRAPRSLFEFFIISHPCCGYFYLSFPSQQSKITWRHSNWPMRCRP